MISSFSHSFLPCNFVHVGSSRPNNFFQQNRPSETPRALVASYILSFHVIDKSSVYNLVAPGRRIIPCKIPIAKIVRARLMKCFYALKNYFNWNRNVFWSNQLRYLVRDLFGSEWFVYLLNDVF